MIAKGGSEEGSLTEGRDVEEEPKFGCMGEEFVKQILNEEK